MESLSDSINWPAEFSELKKLDVILKCGICYEFMNNCMITSCSHTYCSLCIRKFMQYKNQCPTCFGETYEINLRNNRVLDEVINIYTKIREKLLRASRLASINVPLKNEIKEKVSNREIIKDTPSRTKITSELFENFDNEETKDLIRDVKVHQDGASGANIPEIKHKKLDPFDEDSILINGIKVPGMFTSPKILSIRPKKPDELADCPVCQVQVPAKNINIHLDSCLALDLKTKPKVRKRSPLPKRVYTMMSEKNLKRFLREYGLSTNGDRKAMIARLQRYTVIFNAENDAANPRPVSELVKQLEREEKEEKKPVSLIKNFQSSSRSNTASTTSNATKKDADAIEKANKVYRDENKTSFMKLIEEMRARDGRNIKPLKIMNRIYSDDEEDAENTIQESSSSELNDLPTTSGVSNCKFSPPQKINNTNNISINSSGDSDGDIFMDSENDEKLGKIDWNKTNKCDINDTSPELICEALTQKPVDQNESDGDILLTDGETISKDDELKESSNTMEVNNTPNAVQSDSDSSSAFDTSVNKSIVVKSTGKSKRVHHQGRRGSKLSLAWRKKTKEDETDDNDDEENFSGFEEVINKYKDESNRLFVTEAESSSQDSIEIAQSITNKMITRSAKRKSVCDQEKTSNDSEEEVPTTPVATRKKSKRDVSPDF